MRRLTFALAAATALTSASALAADLGPPPMEPRSPAAVVDYGFNWTGFYLGVQGGYGWGDTRFTYVPGGQTGTARTNGGLFGGTAGFNFQAGQWVFGVEGDYAWANISGSIADPLTPALFDIRSNLRSFGTVRGRLGIAWDSLLLYGTGGLAMGDQRISTRNVVTGDVVGQTDFRVGWTAGGGLEWGFAPNWSAKVEALYFDLGTDRYTVAGPTSVDARHSGVVVRGGINYRFGWGGGPVVARY